MKSHIEDNMRDYFESNNINLKNTFFDEVIMSQYFNEEESDPHSSDYSDDDEYD